MKSIKHRFFGIELNEWIANSADALADDAVGMWTIVPIGRHDFGLDGDALEDYVRKTIKVLLEAGAVPVKPSKIGFWEIDMSYGKNIEDITNNIISEWKSAGHDPGTEDVWFRMNRAGQPKHGEDQRANE